MNGLPAPARPLIRVVARIAEIARAMVGVPSYPRYLAHMAAHHPDREPMAEAAFHRARLDARYGAKGGGRCC